MRLGVRVSANHRRYSGLDLASAEDREAVDDDAVADLKKICHRQ